ncbi:hypothetical protein OG21DRAFT_441897 [Imleria badia]|nr:hypothetical protein OG21DRAFT_441897 [Imleria badia]
MHVDGTIMRWGLPYRTKQGAAMSTAAPDTTIHQSLRHVHVVTQGTHQTMVDQKLKEGNEILMWLDGLSCAWKQDETISLRQPDTCEWLFDTTQYKKEG